MVRVRHVISDARWNQCKQLETRPISLQESDAASRASGPLPLVIAFPMVVMVVVVEVLMTMTRVGRLGLMLLLLLRGWLWPSAWQGWRLCRGL